MRIQPFLLHFPRSGRRGGDARDEGAPLDVNLNQWIAPAIVGAIVGLVLGWLLSAGFGAHRKQVEHANALREMERAESDKALGQAKRQMQELTDRTNEQSLVFQFLPDLIRQIFTASGQRTIGPLALNLVDQLFHPEQAAVFVARPSRKKLALAAGFGLPPHLKPGVEVDYGQGRVGYVAEHLVSMDEGDFKMAPGEAVVRAADARRGLEVSGVNGLKADVVAPIAAERDLMGVLCIGAARTRGGPERKKLLTMVADLTAAALVHASRLRASEESGMLDGLTGVHNKKFMFDRLADHIRRAEKDGGPVSVMILDLDHFRHYNQTNGSLQGDEVLKQLGALLKGSVRESDLVARYGGEEFVIVYPGAGKELAMRLGENLRQAIEHYPFAARGQQPLGAVTVSGGVATFPEDSRKADNLLRCADQALYEAKAAGRNRIFPGEPNFLA